MSQYQVSDRHACVSVCRTEQNFILACRVHSSVSSQQHVSWLLQTAQRRRRIVIERSFPAEPPERSRDDERIRRWNFADFAFQSTMLAFSGPASAADVELPPSWPGPRTGPDRRIQPVSCDWCGVENPLGSVCGCLPARTTSRAPSAAQRKVEFRPRRRRFVHGPGGVFAFGAEEMGPQPVRVLLTIAAPSAVDEHHQDVCERPTKPDYKGFAQRPEEHADSSVQERGAEHQQRSLPTAYGD